MSAQQITDLERARALVTGHHATLQAVAPGLGDAVRVILSALDSRDQLASDLGVLTAEAQRSNIRQMLERRTEEACRSPETARALQCGTGGLTGPGMP